MVDRDVLENRQPDSLALGVKARRFVTEWVGVLQEPSQAAHVFLLVVGL